MTTRIRLVLPLVFSLAAMQGCGTVQEKGDDTVGAAKVETITPVAVHVATEKPAEAVAAPAAVAVPLPEPAKAAATATEAAPASAAAPAKSEAKAAGADRYTVLPGDTLASIAAKSEVYGDRRLWPLLFRANIAQIGPRGLIFPTQVLTVDRNYTPADVKTLIGRSMPATATAAAVAKPTATPEKAETKAVDGKAAQAKPAAATTVKAGKESKEVKAAAADITSSAEYLAAARRAFGEGDAAWSIHYYNRYLATSKTDADAWGELGNVYFYESRLADAAKAFFNAANLLIDNGRVDDAMELVPAIEQGDRILARAINHRLAKIGY